MTCNTLLNLTRGACAPLAGLIALVVWILGTVALAQAPSPDTPGIAAPAEPETRTQAAQAVPLAEVPERAQTTSAELDALIPKEASRQRLERIGAEFDRTLPEVESRLAKTREALADRPNVRTLQELEGELSGMLARLRPWDEALDRQLAGLRGADDRQLAERPAPAAHPGAHGTPPPTIHR